MEYSKNLNLTAPEDKALQAELSSSIASLRMDIQALHPAPSREKSLAMTKLDECEMWLARCP